jgi:hypothetical protein
MLFLPWNKPDLQSHLKDRGLSIQGEAPVVEREFRGVFQRKAREKRICTALCAPKVGRFIRDFGEDDAFSEVLDGARRGDHVQSLRKNLIARHNQLLSRRPTGQPVETSHRERCNAKRQIAAFERQSAMAQ